MAIIHTTPKRSGTEGLLKLLDALTDEIVLQHGKILMSQFSQNQRDALKLSLFIDDTVYEVIGVRNVFLEDVKDTVEIRFGNKQQTEMSLELLRQTRDWNMAFPLTHRSVYHLTDLDLAAADVRDYLLFGKLPTTEIDDWLRESMKQILPDKGYVSFNVLATLTDLDEL